MTDTDATGFATPSADDSAGRKYLKCDWPGCEEVAACTSGNTGGRRLVCFEHFKITNGIAATPSADTGPAHEDQQLKCEIANGVLTISIGIKSLAFAAENAEPVGDHFADDNGDLPWRVTDSLEFAREVGRELQREAEDGTNRMHLMFDAAFIAAIENGCEGVDYGDD